MGYRSGIYFPFRLSTLDEKNKNWPGAISWESAVPWSLVGSLESCHRRTSSCIFSSVTFFCNYFANQRANLQFLFYADDVMPATYCEIDLDKEKRDAFVYAIKNHYWYQMYIDDLPIWGEYCKLYVKFGNICIIKIYVMTL